MGIYLLAALGRPLIRLKIKWRQISQNVAAKLWLDTSAKEYSFRYEDLPPYAIEKQYENSMEHRNKCANQD